MANKGTYRKDYYEAHKEKMIENTRNYQSKLSAITFRVKPNVFDRYKAAAANAGMSLRGFIIEAIEEKISKTP